MMRKPRLAGQLLSLTCLLALSGPALGAPTPLSGDEDLDVLSLETPARFIMGFKAGGGGTLWDEPNDTVLRNVSGTDPTFDIPIFNETRGGWTMTAGFFMEGIFYDYLGLEVGAYFTQHTLLEKTDWNYFETVNGSVTHQVEAKSEEELQWTAVHVPILVKAVVPSGNTRISLGVGPEFAFGEWSRAKFKVTEVTTDGVRATGDDLNLGGTLDPPPPRSALRSLRADLQNSVYLRVNFGIEIQAGDFLIPIDIHWSYNFSQGTKYRDRVATLGCDATGLVCEERLPDEGGAVTYDNHPNTLELKTRDTMYGGINIGIAYQFD
ncbi:MAG: hypothetical protein EP329_18560 [Deltaproteobacteria bacterium]|nr:MAG: hypothetical protein EP329_18560 [Deltaproteobacteria bacterium]